MLSRAVPGLWGDVLALVIVGTPVGAAWAAADVGPRTCRTWKTGALFAFASAALYAWIFSGAWV